MMQGWADEGWFENLPTIEQSLRDVVNMDAQRLAGGSGMRADNDFLVWKCAVQLLTSL